MVNQSTPEVYFNLPEASLCLTMAVVMDLAATAMDVAMAMAMDRRSWPLTLLDLCVP